MHIEENVSLLPYNTFHIQAFARYFLKISTADQLTEALALPLVQHHRVLVLGGGSNLLFVKNFDGLIIKNEITGITVTSEDDNYVYVRAGAGENWHRFVLYCVNNNLAGVENLSLIPGSIGACPIQNIGAYGVEIKDVFHELEACHIHDGNRVVFSLQDCAFGYRDSVFKTKYKNQFVILAVTFRLRKKPDFNTSYGALQQQLEKSGQEPSIRSISDAVTSIRQSKLPDPAVMGNAGSFFKNPEVSSELFQKLKNDFNDIRAFASGNDRIKLAAGWLIEQCGWKGYRRGDAGCYEKQALVLVNFAHASGEEIYALSEHIVESVQQKFGIVLEREVNII